MNLIWFAIKSAGEFKKYNKWDSMVVIKKILDVLAVLSVVAIILFVLGV
jgi:hypothetical protein